MFPCRLCFIEVSFFGHFYFLKVTDYPFVPVGIFQSGKYPWSQSDRSARSQNCFMWSLEPGLFLSCWRCDGSPGWYWHSSVSVNNMVVMTHGDINFNICSLIQANFVGCSGVCFWSIVCLSSLGLGAARGLSLLHCHSEAAAFCALGIPCLSLILRLFNAAFK